MLFLILNGADIDFSGCKLWWRTYISEIAVLTIRHIELVDKKEFAVAAFNPEHKTYVVHFGLFSFNVLSSSSLLDFHPFQRPQISGLITQEAFTKVSAKYLDFADVFSSDLVSELPKHTGMNDHGIELVDSCQQSPYEPIYSLGLVELKTLKAYIETNLANEYIRPSKSPIGASILFNQKSDSFLQLCINY